MDKYNEDLMKCCPCCDPECPPQIPVVVERIMRHYRNPDGSYSNRMYYQYPITCFSAVHKDESIHSPTLADVLYSMNQDLNNRQKKLMSGDMNTILTRGRLDGEVGELTKTDYLDDTRRSKTHIPSEHAVFKLADRVDEKVYNEVRKETVRAQAAEETLRDSIVDETNRATESENKLQNAITQLADEALLKSDFCNDTIVKDIVINPDDLSNVMWQMDKINLGTLDTVRVNGSWNLKDPIEEIVDLKLNVLESNFVQIDIFDDVNGDILIDNNLLAGEGSLMSTQIKTYKNVESGISQTETTKIYSDTLSMSMSDVSTNHKEIHIDMKFNDDADVLAVFEQMYA